MVPIVTKFVLVVFAMSMMAALVVATVDGQDRKHLPLEKYDRLYDAMFPRACDAFSATEHEYAIDIRIRPSFDAPYQISISKDASRGVLLTSYRLMNEREPLGEQVAKLLTAGMSMEAHTLALGLKVQKTKASAPTRQTLAAINSFFREHSFPKQTRISLDGVGYDICYVDAGSNIRTAFDGSEVFERGEPTMVTWARRVAASLK